MFDYTKTMFLLGLCCCAVQAACSIALSIVAGGTRRRLSKPYEI